MWVHKLFILDRPARYTSYNFSVHGIHLFWNYSISRLTPASFDLGPNKEVSFAEL